MPGSDHRSYFVITLRGDRGPLSRVEIDELLHAGEIQPGDRLRNAFGRQLGTVEELLATRHPRRSQSQRRQTADVPAAPSRNTTPIIIGIIVLLAVVALLAATLRGTDPTPPPPVPSTPPVSSPSPISNPSPAAKPPPTLAAAAPAPKTQRPGRLEGWTITDIGGAVLPPDVEVRPGGRWWVASAGNDIWGANDQFRLVSIPLPQDGQVTALVHSATGQHSQAKSGVMVRSSVAPTAAFVLLSLSPGGGGELLLRARDGGLAESKPSRHQGLPCWVRLQRVGKRILPSHSADGQTWLSAGDAIELPDQAQPMLAGVAVCSHEAAVMTSVFANVTVEPAR